MTDLDAAAHAKSPGPAPAEAGPAHPTSAARTAHRPLTGLAVRVPSWTGAPQLRVNGEPAEPRPAGPGYLAVTRVWQPGDVLAWTFDVTPRWVYPHPRIDAVRGCAAIVRGPLVYCFETVDQPDGTDLDDVALAAGTALTERPATLPGVGRTVLVEADAARVGAALPDELPYPATAPARVPGAGGPVRATAVPYFQWDNRDGRPMRVWLPVSGAR